MDANARIGPIFLAAGIPDPKRNPKYFTSMDATAIREAVTALTIVVTPWAKLVFGGHPAISPFVYRSAVAVNGVANVTIYQSAFFQAQVPKESLGFNQIVWTPAAQDRDSSLAAMRKRMIGDHTYSAAVFVGGMEGVEDECAAFKNAHPKAKIFPIASTGAAAKTLFDRGEGPVDKKTRDFLEKEYLYQWMFRKLLGVAP